MATLLQPGIIGNLSFSKESSFTDEGSLKIVMVSNLSEEALLTAMANDEAIEEVKSGFIVYPPNLKDFNGDNKSGTTLLGEINAIKMRYLQYAALLGPVAPAKEAFGGNKMLEGLGVEPEKYGALIQGLTNEKTLQKVLGNLGKKFLAYMSAQENFETVTFRHKFYRQSKNKHYASIPFHIKGDIVEPMEVPSAASKLSWSDWEIEKGKNDPTPLASDKPKAKAEKKGDLFGEGDSTPAETTEEAGGLF